jgi:glycosyltransferase domain-containing protein
MDLSKEITILIPTYNRYSYLKRLLEYYLRGEMAFSILIADSSSSPLDDEVAGLIERQSINYLKFPSDLTPQKKILQAIRKITTKYAVLCADDDFVISSAISECVGFMERNQDYSVALGVDCSHSLRKRKRGKIEYDWTPGGFGRSVTQDGPSERLTSHLANYDTATFYGVHRTDTLRLIFEEALESTSHGRMGELLLTGLTLIYGKMAVLPIYYSSREHGSSSMENTLSVVPYFHTSWPLFLSEDKSDEECRRAIDCFAKHLQRQTGTNLDMSTKTAADALNGYLEPLLPRTEQNFPGRFINASKKILFWLRLRPLMLGMHGRMTKFRRSLRSKQVKAAKIEYSNRLEESDPKFHDNFNEIREAVTRSEVHITR